MKYLIIQTAFLGDVVLSLPMAAYLKNKEPGSNVSMLVRPDAVEIAKACPDVDEVLVFDKRKRYKGLHGISRMARQIRQRKFQAVFTPQRYLRSTLVTFLSRIPYRYGFDKNSLSGLYTHCVKYQSADHEILRNLALVRAHWQDASQELILPNLSVQSQKNETIAFAPGAVWTTKRWPVEKWIELIQHPEMQKREIVLIGGPKDKKVAASIMEKVNHAQLENRVGLDALPETFIRIASSTLLISNDSAPTHFAVALRTPVITIFGSTLPEFGFAPVGKFDDIVQINQKLDCRPCGIHGKKRCPEGTLKCMTGISVQQVVNRILEVEEKMKKQAV